MTKKVAIMRSGAPDKALLGTESTDKYQFIRYNGYNLNELSTEEIKDLINNDIYIFCSDEKDIEKANKIVDEVPDQSKIILPLIKDKVIPYSYVDKDSDVYNTIEKDIGVIVPHKTVYSISEFEDKIVSPNKYNKGYILTECAIKTTLGSGSRGVIICNKEAYDKKMFNYHEGATYDDLLKLVNYARDYDESSIKIIIQDLIPISTNKVSTNFVIRNGKLLGYMWQHPEKGSNFTNWNWEDMITNEHTDKYMNDIANWLINKYKITDAFMNFEAFVTDDFSKLYLVEFNWRYSNCTFASMAFGIDLLDCYLNNKEFRFPEGNHKVLRYWKAVRYEDIGFYKDRYLEK